jgi:hypothetical protein
MFQIKRDVNVRGSVNGNAITLQKDAFICIVSVLFLIQYTVCRKDSVAERCFLSRQNLTKNVFFIRRENSTIRERIKKEKARVKVERYVKNMPRLRHTPNA